MAAWVAALVDGLTVMEALRQRKIGHRGGGLPCLAILLKKKKGWA